MKTAVKNTAKTVKTSPNEVSKQRANSKLKTIETRAKNRNANRNAKTAPVTAKKDGIVYLKEGVTGTQFNKAKTATNNAVKEDRATISRCISDAYQQDKGFFESINLSKTALKKVCAPKAIMMHATDYQLSQATNSLKKNGYIKFNVWSVLGWIKAELDGRKPNPNAILLTEEGTEAEQKSAAIAVAANLKKKATAKAKKAVNK